MDTAECFIPTLVPSTLFRGLSLSYGLVTLTNKKEKGEAKGRRRRKERRKKRRKEGRQPRQGKALTLLVAVLTNGSAVDGGLPSPALPACMPLHCVQLLLSGGGVCSSSF